MKLHIFTIVLDGMPFISWHLPVFNRLKLDWHWYIAEGAAMNQHDTKWCRPQSPRLSRDGTTEFLNGLKWHPRITIIQKQRWQGKVEQCNACLDQIHKRGILLQLDCDEFWTPEQIEGIVNFFEAYENINSAQFYCRYFVGPNLVITNTDNYGNRNGEWLRAWRYEPGMKFESHEPPLLRHATTPMASKDQTRECDLIFDHYSYVLESQVAYKSAFYGYRNAVQQWKRLQENKTWPVELRTYCGWVKDNALVDKINYAPFTGHSFPQRD